MGNEAMKEHEKTVSSKAREYLYVSVVGGYTFK